MHQVLSVDTSGYPVLKKNVGCALYQTENIWPIRHVAAFVKKNNWLARMNNTNRHKTENTA